MSSAYCILGRFSCTGVESSCSNSLSLSSEISFPPFTSLHNFVHLYPLKICPECPFGGTRFHLARWLGATTTTARLSGSTMLALDFQLRYAYACSPFVLCTNLYNRPLTRHPAPPPGSLDPAFHLPSNLCACSAPACWRVLTRGAAKRAMVLP